MYNKIDYDFLKALGKGVFKRLMKFSNIVLVSDMDGTLLNEEKQISKENLDAIHYFCKNGGKFTVASGRVYQSIECYFDELHPQLPVISHNGGVISDPLQKQVLHCDYLSGNYKEVAKEIHKEYPWIGIEGFAPSRILFFTDNPYVRKHISDERLFPDNQIEWHSLEEETEEWCKILFACEAQEADLLGEVLPPKYPAYSFVRSDPHYFELLPPGVNKGTALQKLLSLCSLGSHKCYAIGDNMNDSELLSTADVGIAVQNASENLKKQADFVLGVTNEDHAIAHVIELIDKGTI